MQLHGGGLSMFNVSMSPRVGPEADLAKTRAPLGEAYHLPGYIYTDPSVLEIEKERLFMHDWLCVGRAEEIAKPGDYLTFDLLGERVVVARDKAGGLHAFANTCLHRGVAVASGCGNKKMFSCPYHGWLYDLDGRLVTAPYMGGAATFNSSPRRLAPFRVDVWQGWVFINFDADAPDLEEFLGSSCKLLEFIHAEDCLLGNKWEFELRTNWKTVVENFQDVYHVKTLHGDTFGRTVSQESWKPQLLESGKFFSYIDAGVMTPDGQSLFGNLPCWEGRPPSASCLMHINPNIMLFCRWDSIFIWIAWPIDADRTRVIFYTLFHKDHFTAPDLKERLKVYADFEQLVASEDNEMVQSLQQGFKTRAYRPGPLSQYEDSIHHMLKYYLDHVLDASRGSGSPG
jgi:phenylpropionate dioxygenase-like ring-hydroxylating dioxygenase large terminal subunit